MPPTRAPEAPFRLVIPTVASPTRVVLDQAQQAVVDHVARSGQGPLLVLAGPGTGKTTTLVEAVAARVEAGTRPDRILTLTFSRRAAAELRDRIAARLARTVEAQSAWTFHAFAYALAGESRAPDDTGRPLRLLSGPEQDVVLRELLAGDREDRRADWPEELSVALGTRGFTDELRALLARARGFGLEPRDLALLAESAGGRSDWRAAARFFEDYLAVLDQLGAIDYAELIHRAVVIAESETGRAALRARYDLVVVDEYQDTDPAQERLLLSLAGDGRDLVVVGDPDQSIYAFRGAEVRGLLTFRTTFPDATGGPAKVAALRRSRRAGSVLLAASREVTRRMPLQVGDLGAVLREHRGLSADDPDAVGDVSVVTFPSQSAQLDAVADLLRREHLDAGTRWRDMAVLVRSGVRSLPYLRRALGATGVPVEVAGDELPLAREPAAAPLLLALGVVADPAMLTQEVAHDLLISPLGGLDSSGIRQLGRLLRDEERVVTGGGLPRPSAELIREALAEPERLVAVDERIAGRAQRLASLIIRAAEVGQTGTAYDVLWTLWQGTSWPGRLERTSWAGGPAGRLADRDLDAVMALFDAATRFEDRTERRGVRTFLEELQAQQIPADALAERAVRGDAVRLLTAHRSKGLEWDVVAVIDVQEEVWPDLRRRGSLLEAERLAADGLQPPPTTGELLAEERRLFYVAVTRARRRLVVAAVDSPEDDGTRPSRFVHELGVPVVPVSDRPSRPLTLPALIAELRSVASDPSAAPSARRASAGRLAVLASAHSAAGQALAPAAHPDRWWGIVDPSDPGRPLHPPGVAVALSGSSLSRFLDCPLRWFLEHEARAASAKSTALGFGSLVHALADDVGKEVSPADLELLMGRLDRVWGALAFDARWQSERQRIEARQALVRFLAWHLDESRGRRLLASEHGFTVPLRVGERTVVLRGSMDRVELDDDGRVHVVDLKTGKYPPTDKSVPDDPQLGVYQLAVREGAVADLSGGGVVECGGAELVQLRVGTRQDRAKVQGQPPLPVDDEGVTSLEHLIADAVQAMTEESFAATPGDFCRFCQFQTSCPTQDAGRQVVR